MAKIKIARIATASLGILLVGSGVAGELRYGGIDTLGIGQIWATCPLGYLERSLAAREWIPNWPYAALVVLAVILLGRVFCAWLCPTVLLSRVLPGKGILQPKRDPAPKGRTLASYSPYAVLAGVLVVSYWFRFPFFCLFCPVGIFFGFLFAVIKLFSPHAISPSLALVFFPVMLGLELWVMKKSWCRSICPLGALLSIAGSFNRFLLPTVRKDKCLASKGIHCRACARACPEGIDLNNPSSGLAPNSCTKCLECYEKCPAKAIRIAVFR